jgi:hypothetical protein
MPGRLATQEAQRSGWFDVSTFKEPYRLEGKKTMGFEIAEFFGWDVPDVICILPAAAPAWSAYGKHLKSWKRWGGSAKTPADGQCAGAGLRADCKGF